MRVPGAAVSGALRLLAGLGVALGAAATLLGLLAPRFPILELVNHFRPFLLAGALALLALAWSVRGRKLLAAAAILAGGNLLLAGLPLLYKAPAATDSGPSLKIVTLNLWVWNTDVEAAARFLEGEGADVVVLQEAGRIHTRLIERVRGTYPHAYCPDHVCSLALLSRKPWLEAGREDVPPRRPLLVWARFSVGGATLRVAGIHLAYPFEPERQVEHAEWLTTYLRQQNEPTALAGDFNLTPFSWKLVRLLQETGFRFHLIGGFSWPAHRYVPVVLLDNVLTSAGLSTISARVGPRVGSDHRPVIVEVGLPSGA